MQTKKKKEGKSLPSAILVIFISIIFLTSFTGCIDVNLTKNLIERFQEEEKIKRVDRVILSETNQEFRIEFQQGKVPTLEDLQRIATKFYENLTNPGPNTVDNLRAILREENISLKPLRYDFYIVPDTDRIYAAVSPVFDSIFSPQVGGYFEISIFNSTGKEVVHEEVVQTENKKEKPYTFFVPRTAITPGKWSIELRGTGLQSPGSMFYSGKFDLRVHAHEPV